MRNFLVAATVAGLLTGGALSANAGEVYGPYPVTLKGWWGTETNTVSYTGQMARHVLHDSLKSLSGKGNGSPNPALKKRMLSYYANKDAGRAIVAPKSRKAFKIKQTAVDQFSKK